jgi:predicted lipoprotein with Yx(FWY)xxD motif
MPKLSAVLVLLAVTTFVLGIHDLTRGLTVSSLIAPAASPGMSTSDPETAEDAAPDAGPDQAPDTAEDKADLVTADLAAGTVVTTAAGATLYRSDRDSARPPTSNCTGPCAAQWPPMWATNGLPTVDGIDPKLIGLVTRKDGTKQVTLAGWPLYRYAPDSPGEAEGNGLTGTWHAIGPDGNPAVPEVDDPEPGPAPVARPPSPRQTPHPPARTSSKLITEQKKQSQARAKKQQRRQKK